MGVVLYTVTALAIANTLLCGFVIVYLSRKNDHPLTPPLILQCFCGIIWTVSYGVSFWVTNLEASIFAHQVMIVGQFGIPPVYLVLAYRYKGMVDRISYPVYVILSVLPISTGIVVFSNDIHNSFWSSTALEQIGSATLLVREYGILYFIHISAAYLMLGFASVVFIKTMFRSGDIHKKQGAMLLVGGVVPTIANTLHTFSLGPYAEIDFTPFTLGLSALLITIAIFEFDLVDLSPAAYQNVSDVFGDGVIVFDSNHQLVEWNGYSEGILGEKLESDLKYDEVFDVPLEEINGEVITGVKKNQRHYIARHSTLTGEWETVVGHVIVMRDITELKQHQQRLSVTNRILRHNLRNELNLILGHSQYVDKKLSDNDDVDMTGIIESAKRLQSVTENSRYIRSSVEGTDIELSTVDITPLTESAIKQYKKEYPEVTVNFKEEEGVYARISGKDNFKTIVSHLVSNGIEHNDNAVSKAKITITLSEHKDRGAVVVSVADNGPGIPKDEQTVIEHGEETQLQHGSSLGLWIVYWLTNAMGGRVVFKENKPRGSVVEIHLQAGSEDDIDESNKRNKEQLKNSKEMLDEFLDEQQREAGEEPVEIS